MRRNLVGTATCVLSLRTRLGMQLRAGYRLMIAEADRRRAPNRRDLHKHLRRSFATPDAPLERMPPNDGSLFVAALARGDLAGS